MSWLELIDASAILLLQQHHFQRLSTIAMPDGVPQISLDNFWPESLEGVNRLITAATSYMNLTTTGPNKADCIPIFFTHVLYQVSCILLMLDRGTLLDDEIGEKFGVVKSLLLRVNERWRVAGKSISKDLFLFKRLTRFQASMQMYYRPEKSNWHQKPTKQSDNSFA